jgi:fused signal recognition particle receptor
MFKSLFGIKEEKSAVESAEKQPGLLERMKQAVTRTRADLNARIEQIAAIGRKIDEDTLEELEASLIGADLGAGTAHELLEAVRLKVDDNQISNAAELTRLLKDEIRMMLTRHTPPAKTIAEGEPEVIMLVGVNGAGKTTSVGKLAYALKTQGKNVLLCAADTFRAAAIEQLEVWAQRNQVEVIKTKQGGDPSAALFDAIHAARARKTDYLIVDTAGRLHTKSNLMQELDKMRRTAAKVIPGAPHETLLVMDATTGQNGLQQARQFTEAAGVTGIILTKLDGTAKGGIVVAIASELGLPVRYVGVGEQIGDLLQFDPDAFVDGLFE